MKILTEFASLLLEHEIPWDRRYSARMKTPEGEWDMAAPPADYSIQAPVGWIIALTGFAVYIEGPLPFAHDGYASLPALTVGIEVCAIIDEEEFLITEQPIKKLAHWTTITTGVKMDIPTFSIGPGGIALFNWVSGPVGSVFLLNGDNNDRIITKIQDDMSGLTEAYTQFFGVFSPLRP